MRQKKKAKESTKKRTRNHQKKKQDNKNKNKENFQESLSKSLPIVVLAFLPKLLQFKTIIHFPHTSDPPIFCPEAFTWPCNHARPCAPTITIKRFFREFSVVPG